MPIGDLLASITGEKPNTTTATTTSSARPPANGMAAKRKADGDVGGSVQKAPRTTPTANGSGKPTDPATKTARLAERPSSGYTGSARPTPTSTTPRPLAERSASSASKKPSLMSRGKPSPTSSSFPSSNTRPVASSASSTTKASAATTPTSAPDPNAKAPKKGSYAEIKARAAAGQTKLQTIGKIQHKAIVKQPTKKEREQAAAEEAKLAKKGLKPGSKLGAGLAGRNGLNGANANGNGLSDGAKDPGQKVVMGKNGKVVAVEERKPKKAALATTGYAGSARLPPTKAKPGAAKPSAPDKDRGRDKQPNPMGMFGSRRRKDDEYDEDMDDFVVDDEEEEEAYGGYDAPRYRYADEDDDSDMEAGYSDVEDEETQAARMARIEDQREEAILEKRRREKEAKKKALQGRR